MCSSSTGWGRDAGPAVQLAVMVHWLLVLLFGAHIPATEPAAVLPIPSNAVPVPRLMIWKRPPPTLLRRHCWLFPPFQGACRGAAPLAALPQLSATIPLVRFTIRNQPPPRSTNCHCRLVLPSQLHCFRFEPDATLPPLSSTRPVATLPTRTQPVCGRPPSRAGMGPEKLSLST